MGCSIFGRSRNDRHGRRKVGHGSPESGRVKYGLVMQVTAGVHEKYSIDTLWLNQDCNANIFCLMRPGFALHSPVETHAKRTYVMRMRIGPAPIGETKPLRPKKITLARLGTRTLWLPQRAARSALAGMPHTACFHRWVQPGCLPQWGRTG